MAIASINPATGEKRKEFCPFDDAEIEKRLACADKAFRKYRRTTFTQRSELLHAVGELLFQEKEKFAEIITLEMGKLFHDSVAEIEKCARGCRFYAENGERFLEDEVAQTDAAESYVQYQPLGPVLAIMPWNFPFWQVFRFAAPALIAGNVGLLKHASNVPQCALAIEKIFRDAGFEAGVFQTLLIENEAVEKIIGDPRVRAVTLTGSERAGSAVATGAKILCGGKRADRAGYFYEPTVLAKIPKSAPAYREEVFGPVALFFRARDREEAVAIANDCSFGLGASVWTNEPDEQEFFSHELESGMVFVNAMVASDPRVPFGGVKRSGYGRELGAEGIREFTNVKTIWIS